MNQDLYVLTQLYIIPTGLPIPVVAISVGVSHQQYGSDDRLAFVVSYVPYHIYLQVLDISRKGSYMGIHWSHVAHYTGEFVIQMCMLNVCVNLHTLNNF